MYPTLSASKWAVKLRTWYRGVMVSHARERPKLTAKGERARTRIVAASAHLIHQRGVAGSTLEDVKAADVSGSQLYHYLPDKDDLVRAVVG